MKDRKHVSWLYRELPAWVSQGIVPASIADRIRSHYGELGDEAGGPRRWALVVFGLLGAVLIGGGLILLVAHNWETLSRRERAVIALAPLVVSAALGAWLLGTGREATAWRESVGAAQTLATGVALALVSQTYHLGGRFADLMLVWSVLVIPVAYLLRATVPVMLYLVGVTVWTGSSHDLPAYRLWFFPLVALAVPFLWWAGRGNRYHVRSVLVAWLIALILPVGTGFVLNPVDEAGRVWPVVFSSLFALLYLIGQRWWSEGPTVGQRPFQTVGALGVCGLAVMMSFGGAWEPVGFLQRDKPLGTIQESLLFATATGFPVAALAMWVRSWTRRAWDEVLVGGATLFAIVAWILAMQTTGTMGAVLLNVYLFVLGTGILAVGLQQRRLATVNAGMAILAVMILCRFFDMDLSLVVRGVAFIVVGTGFLAVNWFLWKWRRAEG